LISPVGLGLRGDRILVAEPEGGRVLAIQEDEAPAIVATGLSGPNGLALDAAGRLYISEQQTGRILRRSSGGTIRTIATGLALGTGSTDHPLPIPMTLDADGSIVVASPETGAVVRIVPE
jgi:sugar lactone lactonase YvrE